MLSLSSFVFFFFYSVVDTCRELELNNNPHVHPQNCQRTACSYLVNAKIVCIVCCRTSVVTKLSVPIQYITGSWQIQWSICYHTHQVHWLRVKWLQIGAQCVREVVRFQDAYHSFQKVLSGLLMSLTCSFLKTGFQFSYHYVFINIFRKTRHIIKDTYFSENKVSEYHFPSSPGIFSVRLS